MELKQVVQVDDRFQKSVNLFLDLENPAEEDMVEKLKAIKGVLRVRVIK